MVDTASTELHPVAAPIVWCRSKESNLINLITKQDIIQINVSYGVLLVQMIYRSHFREFEIHPSHLCSMSLFASDYFRMQNYSNLSLILHYTLSIAFCE